MAASIRRTKFYIFFLLLVLTLVFAVASFIFFDGDLQKRTEPQVERAMVQVSRLLPQIKENEQAVREVYDNLEERRQRFYQNNESVLEEPGHSGESAEEIIDETLSWMNRVTKLRVGRQGYVIVVSRDDYTILAHPKKEFVGEKLHPFRAVDEDAVIDLSEIDGEADTDDFRLYIPESILKTDHSHFFDAVDEGIYGVMFAFRDTYIICGSTLGEAITFILVRTIFTTLIFFAIAWVFVRYIGFSLIWQKEDWHQFRARLAYYAISSIVVLFVVTWYYQTMMDLTGDIATMNDHAKVAVETLNTYQKYRNKLESWLDRQYLEQCRLAADLVKKKGRENLSRKDLAGYAKDLGVEYIYVFDKKGKVIVTNSPYDHFKISSHKEDPSYAFRPLLDGREYVIQEPRRDEMSDEIRQHIGVSLRDGNDLADGFVQIVVKPDLRENLLAPINVQTVLDNMVIGLPKYALAIDKSTMKIAATTGLGYRQTSIADLGIDESEIKKDFSGFFIIKGKKYYAGVSESEEFYLMPLMRSTDNTNARLIAFWQTLISVAAYALLVMTALHGYREILALRETEDPDVAEADRSAAEAEENNAGDEEPGILQSIKDIFKVPDKFLFENRWNRHRIVPLEQQSPEMRTERIVYRMLFCFSLALVLFETAIINLGIKADRLDGFSYVLLGNWQKGVNLFSFSYCLFLLCVLYVFQRFVDEVLYRIARISDLENETILLLLRNALKYSCALIFLYIGLAKFGINTRALWASAGVLSLMVGFGAKDLVNDVIAGLFIIFEGTFKIGDFIIVGDWFGTVQEIGIRYTKVGYFSDTKIFNNSSLRDIVNCDGDVAREKVMIPVSFETDLLEIEELFERELPRIAENIPGLVREPSYQGVASYESNFILLRISLYCVPYERRKAFRAMLREIKLLFDREHISFPYEHLVVLDDEEDEMGSNADTE